ncbi:hypothetical protein FJ366_00090 [Candidatus Dependentiae bacterium]|nr:hypothetical protein [Candidatus Dependentiae bacterium]
MNRNFFLFILLFAVFSSTVGKKGALYASTTSSGQDDVAENMRLYGRTGIKGLCFEEVKAVLNSDKIYEDRLSNSFLARNGMTSINHPSSRLTQYLMICFANVTDQERDVLIHLFLYRNINYVVFVLSDFDTIESYTVWTPNDIFQAFFGIAVTDYLACFGFIPLMFGVIGFGFVAQQPSSFHLKRNGFLTGALVGALLGAYSFRIMKKDYIKKFDQILKNCDYLLEWGSELFDPEIVQKYQNFKVFLSENPYVGADNTIDNKAFKQALIEFCLFYDALSQKALNVE